MTDNARPSLDELDQMPDDMSQAEQAELLVEPSFDHDLDNEAEELEAEFGPAEDGEFGRKAPAGDPQPSFAGGGGES